MRKSELRYPESEIDIVDSRRGVEPQTGRISEKPKRSLTRRLFEGLLAGVTASFGGWYASSEEYKAKVKDALGDILYDLREEAPRLGPEGQSPLREVITARTGSILSQDIPEGGTHNARTTQERDLGLYIASHGGTAGDDFLALEAVADPSVRDNLLNALYAKRENGVLAKDFFVENKGLFTPLSADQKQWLSEINKTLSTEEIPLTIDERTLAFAQDACIIARDLLMADPTEFFPESEWNQARQAAKRRDLAFFDNCIISPGGLAALAAITMNGFREVGDTTAIKGDFSFTEYERGELAAIAKLSHEGDGPPHQEGNGLFYQGGHLPGFLQDDGSVTISGRFLPRQAAPTLRRCLRAMRKLPPKDRYPTLNYWNPLTGMALWAITFASDEFGYRKGLIEYQKWNKSERISRKEEALKRFALSTHEIQVVIDSAEDYYSRFIDPAPSKPAPEPIRQTTSGITRRPSFLSQRKV